MTELGMSVTERYPRKKRRLCLQPKTPTRPPKKVLGKTPTLFRSKDITLPLKSQKIVSPVFACSSDESTLEIGWDNNSPSPTAAPRSGKNRKTRQKDIAALLKDIPKRKRPSEVNENSSNGNVLTAWMQNNLATSTSHQKRVRSTRKSVKRNHQKQGALSFNEELKRFMETVMSNDRSSKDLTEPKPTRSPSCNSDQKMSPRFLESKQNDSLMLVDNFDDLALEQFDMSINNENNQKQSFLLLKTPKLRRNIHQNTTPNDENIFMKKCTKRSSMQKKHLQLSPQSNTNSNEVDTSLSRSTNMEKKPLQLSLQKNTNVDQVDINSSYNSRRKKKPLQLSRQKTMNLNQVVMNSMINKSTKISSSSVRPKPTLNTDEMSSNKETNSKKHRTSIDLDDELNEILLTQDMLLENDEECASHTNESKKKRETINVQNNEKTNLLSESTITVDCFTKIKNKTDTEFVDKQRIFSTPKLKKADNNSINFDDDIELDDLVFNLEEEIRCKSQETPPSNVSVEQRKLKKRCHTSPFPVSRKQIIKKKTEQLVENELLNDEADLNITEEVNKDIKETKRNNEQSKTFLCENLATKASRQPFKPPFIKKNQSRDTVDEINDNHYEVSLKKVTQKRKNCLGVNTSHHNHPPLGMNLLKRTALDLSVIKKTTQDSEREEEGPWKTRQEANSGSGGILFRRTSSQMFSLSFVCSQLADCKKILLTPTFDLIRKTGLSEEEIGVLKKAVRGSFVDNVIVCKDFKHSTISTGCKEIDRLLRGGLLYPGITEICGESASGKTQLCIQLCLNIKWRLDQDVLAVNNTGALYVCTEDVFPTKRLQQMARQFFQQNKERLNVESVKELTDDIFLEHISEMDDLWSLLDIRLPALLNKSNIKLLILDSVAAIFRSEFDLHELADRAKTLAKLGNKLQRISHQYNLCVVCVNQVSDIIDGASSNFNADGSRRVMPALGLTWSYVVNTRIMLARTRFFLPKVDEIDSADTVIRKLKLVFSSFLPPSQCYFYVDADGVKGYVPDEKLKSIMAM